MLNILRDIIDRSNVKLIYFDLDDMNLYFSLKRFCTFKTNNYRICLKYGKMSIVINRCEKSVDISKIGTERCYSWNNLARARNTSKTIYKRNRHRIIARNKLGRPQF